MGETHAEEEGCQANLSKDALLVGGWDIGSQG